MTIPTVYITERRKSLNYFEHSFRNVRSGGYVALLIQAFLDEKVTGKFLDLSFQSLQFFLNERFVEIQRISVPMPSEIKSAQDARTSPRTCNRGSLL